MTTHFAQCLNAGLRICTDCRRNVDNNGGIASTRFQKMVGATTTNRCAHWMAIPVQAKQGREANG